MILLIDNYDSFTYNLAQLLAVLGAEVRIERNDALTAEEALALKPSGIVVSPGPGGPKDAGISCDVIRLAAASGVPLLGICLGHQCIAEVFGGKVIRAPYPVHGKTGEIYHDGTGLFAGVESPFVATRYHSLCVDDECIPGALEVTALSSEKIVMGLAHRELPHFGFQFHPESILTAAGGKLLANFLRLTGEISEEETGGHGRSSAGVSSVPAAIAKVSEGVSLTEGQAHLVMKAIMNGEVTSAQIAALAIGLRMKGETVDEIVGFAGAMREEATPVRPASSDFIDLCGTGGDGLSTFNISTCAAFVVAGAGVPVAKHGNRAVSSATGSADVLEALGVDVAIDARSMAQCIDECGVGFLFAPTLHAGMRHAAAARREIGVRTVFNLLGPLTNPAGASRQLIGVYDAKLLPVIAEAAGRLGARRVLVVNGHPGMDEVSASGVTKIAEFDSSAEGVRLYEVAPEQFGVSRGTIESIAGGDAVKNAEIARAVLSGERGPRRDVVLANAAVALYAAGKATDFAAGVAMASDSIDSGSAEAVLQSLVAVSSRLGGRR